MRSPGELQASVESYLEQLTGFVGFDSAYGSLAESMRYSLAGGGKRIRPVLCLAVAEAAGAPVPKAVPAAAAVELVHTFSLVHDDLPALDDDDLRRGRPSTHVQFGEAAAILTGDALLAQAFEVVLSYEPELVKRLVRELAGATLNMIRGQHLELSGEGRDREALYELKTGALFTVAAGCGLHVAGVAEARQAPWRLFAQSFGLLFQVVDDILDEDGIVEVRGLEGARALADEIDSRARALLDEIDADTSILSELLSGLSARAAGR